MADTSCISKTMFLSLRTRTRLSGKIRLLIICQILLSSFVLVLLYFSLLHFRNSNFTKDWPPIIPSLPLSDIPAIPRNLYYLNAEDVMCCYIPKVASSLLKPLLRKHEGFSDWQDPNMAHGRKNGLQRLMWIAAPAAMRRLQDPNTKKFVIVRDPFSRLISAYQNKIAMPWPDQRVDFWEKHLKNECPRMVNALQIPEDGPLMSLEQFLTCLLSTDNSQPSNEHWRPQTQLCALDYIQYDRYLHLESLESDVADLMMFLGWQENTTAVQFNRNPVYSRPLADFFSERTVHLTLRYYQTDFRVLGYPQVPAGKIDFYSVFNGTNFHPSFEPPVDFQLPIVDSNKTILQVR